VFRSSKYKQINYRNYRMRNQTFGHSDQTILRKMLWSKWPKVITHTVR